MQRGSHACCIPDATGFPRSPPEQRSWQSEESDTFLLYLAPIHLLMNSTEEQSGRCCFLCRFFCPRCGEAEESCWGSEQLLLHTAKLKPVELSMGAELLHGSRATPCLDLLQ